ncbi:MAG: translation initiation factor IF-2 [Oscillospiraceae bacterium]|nr:translation initiation factor IF-2 [Oscillospiraceae bacterium]
MSSFVKYKIREVAKDFDMPTKSVMNMVTEHFEAPKSSAQVLSDDQLNLVFDLITRENQIDSVEEVFAARMQQTQDNPDLLVVEDAPAKKEQPKAENKPQQPQKNQPAANGGKRPQQGGQNNQQPRQQGGQNRPQQPQNASAQNNNNNNNNNAQSGQQPKRKKERRVVDTSRVTVNVDRFDDRVDELVPEKAQKYTSKKVRVGNKNKGRGGNFGNKRRNEEQEKMRRLQLEIAKKAPVKVSIPDEISVGELASRMKKTGAEVVRCLIKNGIMASVSEVIDYETAAIIAEEMGCKVEKEVIVTTEERLINDHVDTEDELENRPPVVVVMGHVDHGKTSLLDYVRKAHVASGEAGGITQAIGAYQVDVNGSTITFLDTPGHEAFTSMRARGAMCTDVALLVVAADDGIMPQTVESINHAKAAEIPIIVAINKMDLPGANPERIKQEIMKYDLIPEEYGGDTIMCEISAKTGMGVQELLEMVVLTAEMRELKANPNREASGTVIEARLDKGRGPVSTLLVQNGTLKQGDVIIAGTAVGRVRAMTDYRGRTIKTAGPSVPVEIIGMAEVPQAGDTFNAVADERMARQLAEERKQAEKDSKVKNLSGSVTLENLFAHMQEGNMKALNIIVKADVQGSAEAVKASLLKLSNDEVQVKVIHSGVGAVNESDVLLASTSSAIIVGFNVRPEAAAAAAATRAGVEIRTYRIIYECIEEVEQAMKGMLDPKFKEVVVGHATVRQTYKVSSVGTVAGCYVNDGKIQRDGSVRVVRDGIVVHEGELGSLQRFKDSVKEVTTGFECGMTIDKFNDIKEGDVFECFVMEQIKD